ncbi:MAG: hypothetical protein WAM11_15580 [Cyanobium sp.]
MPLQTLPLMFRRATHHCRLRLLVRVMVVVFGIALLNRLAHHVGLEVISVNPLFRHWWLPLYFVGLSTDFSESEKLLDEMASALESLALEVRGISFCDSGAKVHARLEAIVDVFQVILPWFRWRTATDDLALLLQHCRASAVGAQGCPNVEISVRNGG